MDPAAPLLTIDTHIDIPWPEGPSPFGPSARRVDLLKMKAGGLAAGCFAAFIPQTRAGQGEDPFARALAMLDAIRAMATAAVAQGGFRLATTAEAVEAAWAEGAPAVIPCVENGHALGADAGRVRALAARGARYLTLTHNGHNALADSAIPRADLGDGREAHGGLSALGREAIAALNRAGMLVDVSHASKPAMMQAVAVSRTPVIATHSCVRARCEHPRNLDDEQLAALAGAGGVIQITAMPAFLRAKGREETVSVADLADHVEAAVGSIGIAHVGISSDFDGGGGITGWANAGETGNVTAELRRRGFEGAALAALWGGNFLRLLRAAEAEAEPSTR